MTWLLDAIKTMLQTILRMAPWPTKTGLRVVGHPGADAPVLVTCNFDLTVRRVLQALEGMDCYLLVAPSKGINVWCAAGGGMLNAHSVTSVVKTSRIGDVVNHRTLILPQLSAPGIDIQRVEREGGWHCRFGPVYAQDIQAYVDAGFVKTDEMRAVRFPLRDRLEMAAMWAGMLSLVVLVPLLILSRGALLGTLALIWSFSLFLMVFFEPVMRWVPGPVALVKTLVLGLVGVIGVAIYGATLGGWSTGELVGWSIAIMLVALVLGFDLDGTSPLYAGSTAAYWSRKWPVVLKLWGLIGYEIEESFALEVDDAACRGCASCVEACPKAVYEMLQSDDRAVARIVRPEACVLCTACVKQCPERAIVASPPIRVFGEA